MNNEITIESFDEAIVKYCNSCVKSEKVENKLAIDIEQLVNIVMLVFILIWAFVMALLARRRPMRVSPRV